MRRALLLLVLCVSTSGCFVFDELDKGNKILDKNFSKGKAAAAPAPAEKAARPKGGAGWWANAKSISGEPTDEDGKNPVVSCAVGKATKFMRRSDCLSQGGQPKS
jgi:hypothetical protein